MSTLAARGDFQVPTGIVGTVVQVRGVGFQPKWVFFWWNGRDGTVDGAGEASVSAGFGFAASPTSRAALAFSSLHANADGEADTVAAPDVPTLTLLPGIADPVAVDGAADLTALVSDGFDITVVDQYTVTHRVHFLAVGGSDVTDTAIGSFVGRASAGDLDITVGFQPDLVFLLGWDQAGDQFPGTRATPCLGIAAGVGASDQFLWAGRSLDNAATTDAKSYCRRGEVIANNVAGSDRASLSAWLPTGFRLTYSASSGSKWGYYLAVKGGRYKVSALATSTSNGTSLPITGIGFAPKAALFVSSCSPENAGGTASANVTLSIGAATSPSAQAAVALQDKDAQATSDTWTALDYDKVYVNPDVAAAQAVEGLMALATFDGDGLTGTMTDGDPVASFVGVLCIGQTGGVDSEEDASGLIYIGAPILYTDAAGFQTAAVLETAQARYGDTVDLAVLRVVGTAIVKAAITSVPHISTAATFPYWVELSGERTQSPILLTS